VNQSLLERRYRVIGKGAPLIVNEAGTMQSVCVAGLRRLPARSPPPVARVFCVNETRESGLSASSANRYP